VKEIQSEEVPISCDQIMEESKDDKEIEIEKVDSEKYQEIESNFSPEKLSTAKQMIENKSVRSILSKEVDELVIDDEPTEKLELSEEEKEQKNIDFAYDDQEYQYSDINSIEKVELIERLMVVRRTLLSNIEMFSSNSVLFNEFNMVF
jgi:hypothetical protein